MSGTDTYMLSACGGKRKHENTDLAAGGSSTGGKVKLECESRHSALEAPLPYDEDDVPDVEPKPDPEPKPIDTKLEEIEEKEFLVSLSLEQHAQISCMRARILQLEKEAGMVVRNNNMSIVAIVADTFLQRAQEDKARIVEANRPATPAERAAIIEAVQCARERVGMAGADRSAIITDMMADLCRLGGRAAPHSPLL